MSASRVFSFDDPHQYGATIRAATVDLFPTAKGRFHADLMQIDLDRLWLQRARENLPRICQGAVNAGRVVIEFLIGDQPAIKHSGIAVSPGEIVVNDSAFNHRRSFAPCHSGTMSLTHRDLAVLQHTLVGREIKAPSVTEVFRPAPALMANLLTLHQAVAQLATTSPAKLAHPEITRALEQGLTHAFIRCLAGGLGGKAHVSHIHHSKILARFEELLLANSDRSLY